MMRDQNSIKYEIAQRQIVLRDMPQKSIFTHIQCLLDMYGLPSVFELMCNTPPKLAWKNTLNRKIHEMVELSWKTEITNKSSTKYINVDVFKVGASHHVWSTVRNNVHDSRRAQLSVGYLLKPYILQANRAAFNQFVVKPTCRLCSALPEARQHFIAECVALKKYRQDYIKKLTDREILTDEHVCQLREPEFLTQLTLDCSVCIDLQILGPEKLGLLELYSREYLYIIYIKRLTSSIGCK